MSYTRPAWAPTVLDVAAVCPAYTRASIGDGGAPQYTFLDDPATDPSATAVEGFIDAGVGEVLGRVGVGPLEVWAAGQTFWSADAFLELAARAVTWHAAATIEAERAPAGADEVDGAYRWKQASYVACLNELISQARYVRPAID